MSWVHYQVSNEREICRIMNVADAGRVKLVLELGGEMEG